jgi:phosphoglycerate dehydrogenase-like enzyme
MNSSAQPHIVVAIPFSPSQKERLERAAPQASFVYSERDTALDDDVVRADIVMGNLPPRQLGMDENLAWVQLASAGADAYSAPGVLSSDALLTNAVGAYGPAVSEHMFAMLLTLMKKLHLYRDNQSGHVWEDRGSATALNGADVLVLGLGDIGRHFAVLASALGAHVTGVKRTPTPAPQGVEKVLTMENMNEALSAADVVVSFLPGGNATHHVLDTSFFARMKDGTYFLNGGRGSVVDTDALRSALVSGHLAGAGLDVTDPEPLPAADPLWDVPNALITPHIAGGYHLEGTTERICDICVDNLTRFSANQPLSNLVQH